MVGDVRSAFSLAPTPPAVYRPVTPTGFTAPSMHGVSVAVRAVPGFDAATRLRSEIEAIDPRLTVFQVTRIVDDLAQTQYLLHFATLVYAGMGVFGLIQALETLAETTRTSVTDPLLLLGGPALLAVLAFAVCYLPARHSTRIDPAAALRSE